VLAVGTGGFGAVRIVLAQRAEAEGEVVQGPFFPRVDRRPPSRPVELVSVDGRPYPRRDRGHASGRCVGGRLLRLRQDRVVVLLACERERRAHGGVRCVNAVAGDADSGRVSSRASKGLLLACPWGRSGSVGHRKTSGASGKRELPRRHGCHLPVSVPSVGNARTSLYAHAEKPELTSWQSLAHSGGHAPWPVAVTTSVM
jgi:hypothetical protein